MKEKSFNGLRFAIAGILCVASAYFTEKTLGAVSSLPITVICCAVAYLIYRRPFAIISLCALGGLVFKAAFTSDLYEILKSVGVCVLFSALPVISLTVGFCGKISKKIRIPSCIALLVLSVFTYSLFYGTFPGILTSKELNESYIRSEYPDIEFTVNSTYYSVSDGRYVTEALFRDKEVYSALFSASDKGQRIIDGYRDYSEARLLQYGTDKLKAYLEFYVHEGENFALRRGKIVTAGKILASDSPEAFLPLMTYDIAFYKSFSSPDDFEKECRTYASYIPEEFPLWAIRFYGLGEKGEFEYQLDYAKPDKFTDAGKFDKASFERYTTDNDTHEYWSIIK